MVGSAAVTPMDVVKTRLQVIEAGAKQPTMACWTVLVKLT